MQYVIWADAVRFGFAELSRREQLEFWRDAVGHINGALEQNRGEDGKLGEAGMVALTEIDDLLTAWTLRSVEVKNGEDWESVTDRRTINIDGMEYAIALPMSRDLLLDLPGSIYDALIIEAAAINEALRQRFLAGTDAPTTSTTTSAE